MNTLDFIELQETFYKFKRIANKLNFYNEYLDEIEYSLFLVNPFQKREENDEHKNS